MPKGDVTITIGAEVAEAIKTWRQYQALDEFSASLEDCGDLDEQIHDGLEDE